MKILTTLLACALVFSAFSSGAQVRKELSPGYYVVIAAYADTRENVAQNYVEILNRQGIQAGYGFNNEKKFFYVYLNYHPTLKESLVQMQQTRKSPAFSQAWVCVIPGTITADLIHPPSTRIVDVPEEDTVAKDTPPVAVPVIQTASPSTVARATVETPAVPKQPETSVYASAQPDAIVVTDNAPIKQFPKMTLGNTEVFLSLYNATNNRIVDGIVTVIDPEDERPMKQVSGNEYLILPNPKNKSGRLILRCDAFGYRQISHEINFNLPLADTVNDYIDLMGTTFVVNFDLVRYRKGDIATLFNVYFYNDAAIMLPESRKELATLLQMMKENPQCRIMLHGHTNGNYHGKIMTVGSDRNFFSLENAKSTIGSAKDLSYDRAEVIKEYLEANGIAPDRVEVKAWGGKRAIYDKHSVNAKKNVRVEVEILSE